MIISCAVIGVCSISTQQHRTCVHRDLRRNTKTAPRKAKSPPIPATRNDSDTGRSLPIYFTSDICDSNQQKPITEAQIDDYFNSSIRPSSDPSKYAPTFKIGIPLDREGNPDVEVFDDREEKRTWAEFEEALKDGEFCCIVRVPTLYFMPKMFGMTVQLQSVQFFPNRKISGFAFRKRSRDGVDDQEGESKRAKEEEDVANADTEGAAAFL